MQKKKKLCKKESLALKKSETKQKNKKISIKLLQT